MCPLLLFMNKEIWKSNLWVTLCMFRDDELISWLMSSFSSFLLRPFDDIEADPWWNYRWIRGFLSRMLITFLQPWMQSFMDFFFYPWCLECLVLSELLGTEVRSTRFSETQSWSSSMATSWTYRMGELCQGCPWQWFLSYSHKGSISLLQYFSWPVKVFAEMLMWKMKQCAFLPDYMGEILFLFRNPG